MQTEHYVYKRKQVPGQKMEGGIVVTEKDVRYADLDRSLLLKALGYSPNLRIIDMFLGNPFFDFTKEEIVRELGMSKQTVYKYFKDLEELGLVKPSRKIGKATLYRINTSNPMVQMLNEYVTKMSLEIAEKEAEKMAPKISARRR